MLDLFLHFVALLSDFVVPSICVRSLLLLKLDTLQIFLLRRLKLRLQVQMLSLHRLFHLFNFCLVSGFSMKDLLVPLIELVDGFLELRLELFYL